MSNSVLEKVNEIAKKVCIENSYQYYSCYFENTDEGQSIFVEVDKNYQIDMEQIEFISNLIIESLDSSDPSITENYSICITSPGAERKVENISDIVMLIDRSVKVVTTDDEEISGKVISADENSCVIRTNNKGRIKNHNIELKDIKDLELVIIF